jgi:hypothetical protein
VVGDAGDNDNDCKSELVFSVEIDNYNRGGNVRMRDENTFDVPFVSHTPTALSLGRYENYQYFPHATAEYDASN